MLRYILLFSLFVLLSASSVYADDAGNFSNAINSANAHTAVPSDPALAEIMGLFSTRYQSLLSGDFGGFQDVLNVIVPSGASDSTPPIIAISATDTYGGLSVDLGMIPPAFWSCLNLVSLILTGWLAFTIVVRP